MSHASKQILCYEWDAAYKCYIGYNGFNCLMGNSLTQLMAFWRDISTLALSKSCHYFLLLLLLFISIFYLILSFFYLVDSKMCLISTSFKYLYIVSLCAVFWYYSWFILFSFCINIAIILNCLLLKVLAIEWK